MIAKHSDSLWRMMWICCLLAHKIMRGKWCWFFWRWWYENTYGDHGVYALMYLAKDAGYPWAQPFGGGEEAVRYYLGGRWRISPSEEPQ